MLRSFILRTVLLLAPCFAGWFFIAPYHAAILAPLSQLLVEPWRVGLVSAVERTGATLTFVTGIEAGSSGQAHRGHRGGSSYTRTARSQ